MWTLKAIRRLKNVIVLLEWIPSVDMVREEDEVPTA
jgi:hypothetical protein